MEKSIGVAIVEDTLDIRESIRTLIGGMPGFSCVGAYATAEAAIADVPLIDPDVVLMDINLPGMNGIEAVKILKSKCPHLAIVMCTVFEDDEKVFQALKAGAAGYILKSVAPIKILDAIQEVFNGGAPMTASIARRVIHFFHEKTSVLAGDKKSLSEREIEVLGLLSKGLLYKEVASRMNLSVETVRSHCRNIYEKLQVNSKIEAINAFYGRS